MATVLVAGASGGTGLRLLDALAATDYEVHATTRSTSKREELLDAGADDVAVGDLTTRDVLVAEGGATVSGTVPRADVARLMVAALDTQAAANRTFEVVSREGLRGRARGLVDVDWAWPDE